MTIMNKRAFEKDNHDITQHLSPMGWDAHFQTQLHDVDDDWMPARVVGVSRNTFRLRNEKKEWLAGIAGRLANQTHGLYPVIGDWVLAADTMILKVLARKNALTRGASGGRGKRTDAAHKAQVLAANLDTVFIVCGLDRDFNLRRIERYLTLIYNCGLNPVILLTKADLHQDPMPFVDAVESIAFGVPIHVVSAMDETGLTPLEPYLSPGRTVVLVGSSGAGKSTLLNRLYGKPLQATAAVSERIRKGRHTTTSRDLFVMPQGGMVIDNPGIREIAFWHDAEGIDAAFPEIETLAADCRFSDCSHAHEPGCRVLQAVSDGEISRDRLESYLKMKRELAYLSSRQHKSADRVEKEQWRAVALKIKAMKKRSGHD